MKKENIEKAVNWWIDHIRKPEYDNGEPTTAGILGFMAILAGSEEIPDEKIEIFREVLYKGIETELDISGLCQLHFDYHPEGILMQAYQASGIDDTHGSFKTTMIITNECVRVSAGYRNPFVII